MTPERKAAVLEAAAPARAWLDAQAKLHDARAALDKAIDKINPRLHDGWTKFTIAACILACDAKDRGGSNELGMEGYDILNDERTDGGWK